MKNAILVDLDGTLCDLTHRLHFIQGEKKDYDSFYKSVYFDKPTDCVSLARILQWYNQAEVLAITGRPESCRQDTMSWLALHGIFPEKLLMRADGDYRKDDIIKQEILDGLRQEYTPILVIDDRPSVVEMWKRNNIPVVHVHRDDWYGEAKKNYAPLGATILYLMVGPSGGGKTTWISKGGVDTLIPDKVLSSDEIRKTLTGDFRDQTKNTQVFDLMHSLTKEYTRCGIPVIYDATNIRRKDRMAAANLVPKGCRVCYIVVDRFIPDKIRDAGWRKDVVVKGKSLIEYQQDIFNSNLKDILAGDGLDFVDVKDCRL